MRIAITGANGHLGRRLIKTLAGEMEIVAVVRSSAAQQRLQEEVGNAAEVVQCDYTDADSLKTALVGAERVVHLPGIIKESRENTFAMAHEDAAKALLAALRGSQVEGVIYLSILGAHVNADNACLASKARAEALLFEGAVPTRVIKVPMVLGEGDFATRALQKKARRRLNFELRASSLEQPIYAGDVIEALRASLAGPPSRDVLELAGPESLSRRALIKRAGAVLQQNPAVISLPFALGWLVAGLLEMLMSRPPVTRAMLGVLNHDDAVETSTACSKLGMKLTSLDVLLPQILKN